MAMALNFGRILSSRTPLLFKLNVGQNLYQNALFTTSANKCVQLKIVKPTNHDNLSYEEKNSLLKREQSPHLTIYKPQLTSMISISHRISGLALTGFAACLCIGAVLPPNDISYWLTAIEGMQLNAATLAFIKFYLALPVTFHTLNGVRHLFWDNGKFLNLNEVYKTGYTVLGLSVVSALILAAM
ncbi:succinate dehydrogenase cytochrome b560 subunit, mitochondrial-like [Contarinia nasturtii]|uniref:succinate dehydrogenase cytochrome b560 subunit, mitochondrial-like n=1 Tax=Contarinia nasturtii TaxID=265458 RepID=UPI0012D3BA35|nr:succinate dehydrogenase cytochrome b560 subunit, mitochondrial-like [Contarinia nasturtii]